MLDEGVRQRIERYLARARRALRTGYMVLEDGDYIAAVNRAYYAVFYAANALLATQGLERSKHSGVIAAFRQQFVKTGLIEAEYSDRDLERAGRFLERVEEYLHRMEALA